MASIMFLRAIWDCWFWSQEPLARLAAALDDPRHSPLLSPQTFRTGGEGMTVPGYALVREDRRFDLKAGRILAHNIAIDKRILGFSGEAIVVNKDSVEIFCATGAAGDTIV